MIRNFLGFKKKLRQRAFKRALFEYILTTNYKVTMQSILLLFFISVQKNPKKLSKVCYGQTRSDNVRRGQMRLKEIRLDQMRSDEFRQK